MFGRFTAAATVICCTAVYAFAGQAQATFIMTDGQRKSGQVVFHGSQANNLIDNQLNLGSNGKEESFPESQVAVIDFSGGTPSQNELSQVPASGNAIAMRGGSVQTGQFVNIRRGDTVIWRDQSGNEQQYNVSQVDRIYLNPQAARTAFNYTGPTSAVATSGQTSALEPGAVRVEANQQWTNTGIAVRAGDLVTFRTTGQIAIASGGEMVGADGQSGMTSPRYPVPRMSAGGLVAKVANSQPFPIGSNTAPIRMPANGVLMLGVNDDQLGDNSGFFSVVVTKTGQRR